MGTGIYDFYVDYRISMDVLYNTTFTGGFIFNGGTITVTHKLSINTVTKDVIPEVRRR